MESPYICPTKASPKILRKTWWIQNWKSYQMSGISIWTRSINSQGFGFGRRMLDVCLVLEIEGLWIFVRPFALALYVLNSKTVPSLFHFNVQHLPSCMFFNKKYTTLTILTAPIETPDPGKINFARLNLAKHRKVLGWARLAPRGGFPTRRGFRTLQKIPRFEMMWW